MLDENALLRIAVISYQILFVANFLLTVLLMKSISWILTPPLQRIPYLKFCFTTPYLSLRSLRYESPVRNYSLPAAFLLYSLLMAIFLVLGHEFLSPLNYFKTILIAPAIYFFTEAIGALAQFIFTTKEREIFPIHHRPLSSPSLSQFWGRRWNLWIQDWLKDISSTVGRRSRAVKITTTFLISGCFHEVMVNLPFWLKTGESYFGTMMGYFLIQALGLYIDKKIFKHAHLPHIRRIYLWLVVALPSPLFVNLPLLTFFGVTNPFP